LERRLAAILAADVAGYSGLMERDEAGTLDALKSHQAELIDPLIAAHRGRIVKLMGDGMLVEFASAVEAVACAAAFQEGMAERNAQRRESERLEFRIGINLGDVLVDGDDIHGDGVNVAARLEGLAQPGGICISGTVFDQVDGKLEIGFENLGERDVKNITKPVRVYRVGPGAADDAPRGPAAEALSLPDRPSIAVLPFDNMSGDPEQEYFADGISEDLITALSKVHWFFVIARNSTFSYKGEAVDVARVARELGVRYVLEGSVRKSGNRVRITAQLIDAATGNHVWAERYDRDLDDIFALQDEMTQTIVGAVEPELGAAERARAARKPPGSLDAWETFQRGLWHMWRFTKDDIHEAQCLLRRAQELDPGFAIAFARESFAHYLDVILGYAEAPQESVAAAMSAAQKALTLDEADPVAHFAIGRAQMLRGDHDTSIAELEKALQLDPSFAQARHGLGMVLALAGRLDESVEELEKSIRLSPRDPLRFATETVRAFTALQQHEFETAAEWARKATRHPAAVGGGYWPYAVLASALSHLGRSEEAQSAIAAARAQKPDLTLSYIVKTLPTKPPGDLTIYLEGLRLAGLED
jgi:adenylate cyclase